MIAAMKQHNTALLQQPLVPHKERLVVALREAGVPIRAAFRAAGSCTSSLYRANNRDSDMNFTTAERVRRAALELVHERGQHGNGEYDQGASQLG